MNPGEFARLAPAQAIEYMRGRRVVLPADYYARAGTYRSLAFSVAGVATIDALDGVLAGLTQALADGDSFADWKRRALADPALAALPAGRLDTIFRTNVQGAYARGTYQRQAEVAPRRRFLMYDAINDSRTRPAHRAMDNFIAPHDDPIWKTHRPPMGYRCRCTLISLTEAQARERGYGTQDRPTVAPDPGWEYDRAEGIQPGVERAVRRRSRSSKVATTPSAQPAVAAMQKAATPPAAWFQTAQPDLADMKARGAALYRELVEDLVLPDDPKLVPRMTLRGRRVGDVLAGADASFEAPDMALPIRANLNRALAERVGTGAKAALLTGGAGAKAVERASKLFPAAWVLAANRAPLAVRATQARGHYNSRHWDRTQRKIVPFIQTDASSTAVHEYAHHLQYQLPDLDAVYQAEHRLRTAGEPRAPLYPHAPGEAGRRDGYIEPYQGREYTPNAGSALEVLTMALQAILGDDSKSIGRKAGLAEGWFGRMLLRDRAMIELTLGLLFHYRP